LHNSDSHLPKPRDRTSTFKDWGLPRGLLAITPLTHKSSEETAGAGSQPREPVAGATLGGWTKKRDTTCKEGTASMDGLPGREATCLDGGGGGGDKLSLPCRKRSDEKGDAFRGI